MILRFFFFKLQHGILEEASTKIYKLIKNKTTEKTNPKHVDAVLHVNLFI